jgi:DNA-binding NtrC family response regulator
MNTQGQPLIGDAPAFRRMLKAAQMVAGTDANVLLIGESGTGKECVARVIHARSRRAQGLFLPVRCAGLDDDGLQAALDGESEGPAAGTLFLDEVAELPPEAQGRLVRALDDGRGERLRVIASTTRDLWTAVEAGAFRRDLYYRLYVVPLEVPPLRERVQDIGPLVEHFVSLAAETHQLPVTRFTATAERQLRRYAWPGNVRELANLCERLVILFPGGEVGPDNLPWEVRRGDAAPEQAPLFRMPETGINLRDLEVEVIRQALALAGGNKSRAARLLGLSRDTLLYRIQKYLIRA